MGKQLYEKVNGEYVPIFPKNLLENIKESEDGRTLAEVLTNFNSIYIPYTNSVEETRNLIPDYMRRKGLSISYNIEDDTITEYYKGTEEDIVEHWSDDNNWEVIPDLDFVRQEAAKLPDGIVTPDKLSPALQELIKQNNTITNLPDDEDLEERNGVISRKNKKYNPYIASGKGYKILRKNWVKGRNILTQDMINESDTIYEIGYDYDLDDKEITIPEGCILKFVGGSFKNGIIIFNDTININPNYIKCKYKGTIKDKFINDINFGNNCEEDSLYFLINNTANNNGVLNLYNDYNLDYNNTIDNGKYEYTLLYIKNNNGFTINFYNKIYDTITNNEKSYCLLTLENCNNININNLYYNSNNNVDVDNNIVNTNNVILIHTYGDNYNININVLYCKNIITPIKQGSYGGSLDNKLKNKCINGLYNSNIYINDIYNVKYGSAIEIGYNINIHINNFNFVHRALYLGGVKNSKIYISGRNADSSTFILLTDSIKYNINDINYTNPIYIEPSDLNIFVSDLGSNFESQSLVTLQCYGKKDNFVNRNIEYVYDNINIEVKYSNDKNIVCHFTMHKHTTLNDKVIVNINNIKTAIKYLILYTENTKKIININNSIIKNILYLNTLDDDVFNVYNSNIDTILNTNSIGVGTLNIKNSIINNINGNNSLNVYSDIYLKNVFNISQFYNKKTIKNNSDNYINDVNNNIVFLSNISDNNFNIVTDKNKIYNGQSIYYIIVNDTDEYKNIFINGNNTINLNRDLIKVFPHDVYYINIFNINDKIYYYVVNLSNVNNRGQSNFKPILKNTDEGVTFFDTTIKQPIWWNGLKWINSKGISIDLKEKGSFSEKPISSDNIPIGFSYFCTDKQTSEGSRNGIMIYYAGNNTWVDALGRVVS